MILRIHSSSGLSENSECRASPVPSIFADVVMDDSMHNTAAIASSCLTSFLNISLACAKIRKIDCKKQGQDY
jgi:hypothetical protein